MYSTYDREIKSVLKRIMASLSKDVCHHRILIQAPRRCQETRAYPATQTADTEGLLPKHLTTDP